MSKCGLCGKVIVGWGSHSIRCGEWMRLGRPVVELVGGEWVVAGGKATESVVKRGRPRLGRVCRVCGGVVHARGLCRNHYQQEWIKRKKGEVV